MRHFKTIFALSLTLFTLSCKKKENTIEYHTNYVNTDMLSKYYFSQGTYWIYENQNNNIDSVIVTGNETGLTSIPCPHGCPDGVITQTEFKKMNLFNVTENLEFNFYFTGSFIRINGGGQWGQNGQPIFLYNDSINYEFNGARIIEKNDSLTILGNKYFNVTKVKITTSDQIQNEFQYDTFLYFAENVGLIKKEINDTINGFQTWNLKRYIIMQ